MFVYACVYACVSGRILCRHCQFCHFITSLVPSSSSTHPSPAACRNPIQRESPSWKSQRQHLWWSKAIIYYWELSHLHAKNSFLVSCWLLCQLAATVPLPWWRALHLPTHSWYIVVCSGQLRRVFSSRENLFQCSGHLLIHVRLITLFSSWSLIIR